MAGGVTPDDPLLTIDDIIRSGACVSGAYATLKRVAGRVSAAMPASKIRALLTDDEQRYVDQAEQQSQGDGNGDGYGDGDGYGNGDGYGYGNGYGDGYGYGYGYGYGDGW